MTGRNVLQFNEATICAAVQHYLNTVLFKEPVKVESVTRCQSGYATTFEVTVEPADKEPAE